MHFQVETQTLPSTVRAKKSVWQAWQIYDDVTETFVSLASNPFQLLNLYGKHSYRSSKD